MSKLSAYLSLSRAERLAFWQLLFLIPPIQLALHCFGFRKVETFLRNKHHVSPASREVQEAIVKKYRQAIFRIDRNTPKMGQCLARSLVLQRLMRKQRVDTKLRIGHRNAHGQIEGHAWLEWEGDPVIEKAAHIQDFVMLEIPIDIDVDLLTKETRT